MVLHKLVTIREALQNPVWVFIVGGIVSTISVFISFLVFAESVGLFSTFLITIAMMPFMINLITYETVTTEEEIMKKVEMNFFERHKDVLLIYIAFFGGVILSQTIIYLMLPDTLVQKIFAEQIEKIKLIRGKFIFLGTFEKIIFNNLGVLILCYLFSFLYGAGSIFILAWNASILATAIGITAKSIGGVKGLPLAILTFFPHGSLELIAYFIGGIAGGLISVALTRKKTKLFWEIVKDSLLFLLSAVVILIAAGIIETIAIVSAQTI
jgi:uncharacterized membrane protein SpoIIM required for sporulation